MQNSGTPQVITRSLHDALPISWMRGECLAGQRSESGIVSSGTERTEDEEENFARQHLGGIDQLGARRGSRRHHRGECQDLSSEEHTTELQSPCTLVCRLLPENR